MQQDFASETTAIQPALVVSVVYTIGLVKEVQIVYRLFLVNCYLLLSKPTNNVGGWVIDWTGLNWLDST